MKTKGKVILVTGASHGIGCAAARLLAQKGAQVVFAARSREKLEAEAAAVGATALPLDVTSDESVQTAVATVIARFGRIDAVINCAGNPGALGFWHELDADAMRKLFDSHVFGMERVIRAVVPHMLAAGSGTIMNIASTVGWVAMPSIAAYSAAKAAVISFSTALRGELGARGIDVLVFGPPHTRNPAGDAWPLGVQTFPEEWVAHELVRALERGRRSFLAGATNRLAVFIHRMMPRLGEWMMRGIGLRARQRLLPG
jgi:NAD(P)-dependent dehydrogenase (short-subunit alcohol dehydrogenase family)